MTPQEIIDVVTAFRDGAEIEFRVVGGTWYLCTKPAPTFDFSHNEYRVKPKPPATETVKLLAYIDQEGGLFWRNENMLINPRFNRVPSEDKTVEVEL